LIVGVELGIDTFDCALPTRLGRHGVALVPDPASRWRLDLVKAPNRGNPEPILDGCSCATCSSGYSRAYLHYLLRARELTGLRLVTVHNLHYIHTLMLALRGAIDAGRLPEVSSRLRAGEPPTSCIC
jgi:queuine tRNA-ribosyltransferase